MSLPTDCEVATDWLKDHRLPAPGVGARRAEIVAAIREDLPHEAGRLSTETLRTLITKIMRATEGGVYRYFSRTPVG